MRNNIKNKLVIIGFMGIILGLSIVNILKSDYQISYSERRKLAVPPSVSVEKIFNGAYFEELEKYLLDQFIFRDTFRSFKAYTRLYLLNQKDNNDVYIVDGSISKIEYPLKERQVLNAAKKLNDIHQRYLQGMNVSYAIIPDKNYFLASQNGYLSMDYDEAEKIMQSNVRNMNYIDLFNDLTLDDYYATDLHWRQEKLINVANKIFKEMGNKARISAEQFTEKELYPFYGAYYGQAALKIKPDTLIFLINEQIENAQVFDYELGSYGKIYETDKFEGIDPYDIFLSGAKPLLSILNSASDSKKELIIFRDSFGSSIAPLLIEGYSKITLIDLRYIATELLEDFIDFSEEQDVLFLYNAQILNNSVMLK